MEKAQSCSHCGTRLEEWDPTHGGDLRAYYPEVYRCRGCMLAQDELEATMRAMKGAHGAPNGLYVRLVDKRTWQEKKRVEGVRERNR